MQDYKKKARRISEDRTRNICDIYRGALVAGRFQIHGQANILYQFFAGYADRKCVTKRGSNLAPQHLDGPLHRNPLGCPISEP
jgi:hypothetical protein